MKEFFDFAGEHPILTFLLVATIVGGVGNMFRPRVKVVVKSNEKDN